MIMEIPVGKKETRRGWVKGISAHRNIMGKCWTKLCPRVDSSRIQVVWRSYNKKWNG